MGLTAGGFVEIRFAEDLWLPVINLDGLLSTHRAFCESMLRGAERFGSTEVPVDCNSAFRQWLDQAQSELVGTMTWTPTGLRAFLSDANTPEADRAAVLDTTWMDVNLELIEVLERRFGTEGVRMVMYVVI